MNSGLSSDTSLSVQFSELETKAENLAPIDQVESIEEAQAGTQEKVDAIGAWFGDYLDYCEQTDMHECYCAKQDQYHPIIIG